MRRRLLIVFVLVLVACAAPLAKGMFALHPLFLSSPLRARTQAALTRIADERGLLLSNLSLVRASHASFMFLTQRHTRGEDERTCETFTFSDHTLAPCTP